MKKKQKIIILILLIILLCVLVFKNKKEEPVVEEEIVIEEVVVEENTILMDELAVEHRHIYDDNMFGNPDYRGQLVFESGLIDEPFVQFNDNDFYLRRDYKTFKYSVLGTVFMDYECSLDSQNIIIYGHNAFDSYNAGLDENGNKIDNDTLMFTSLKYFTDKSFYEDNKYIDLILGDRICRYEVVSSFYADLMYVDGVQTLNPDLYYYIPEYDLEYFIFYKQNIKDVEFYDTGVDFDYDDKLLTLQTCVDGNDDLRQIVLCKLIETKYY